MLRTSAPLIGALDFITGMPFFRDTTSWRMASKDVVYKEPYSEATGRVRRKTIFFSFLVVLNNYYPVDLQASHFLGLAFELGKAPTLSGILGLLVIFFTIELSIYSVQELSAWWSQASEMLFLDFEGKFKKLTDHDPQVIAIVEKTREQLREYEVTIADLPKNNSALPNQENANWTDRIQRANDNGIRLENWLKSLEESATLYRESVFDIRKQMAEVKLQVGRAVRTQFLRVGIVETIFPLAVAGCAIWLSSSSVANLLGGIIP